MKHTRRVRRLLLGLVVIGTILGSGSLAQAYPGISIKPGGLKKFGDPFYFYVFETYLDPQFEMQLGDSVTFHLLAGVSSPGSTTSSPNGSPDPSGPWTPVFTNQPSGFIPNYSPPTLVPFADVTFFNAGATVSNTDLVNELYLGQFRVLTAVSLPELSDDYLVDISWSAKLHTLGGDPVEDSGTVRLGPFIPEPSSVILLGAGVCLPVIWMRRRRMAPAA